MLVFLLGGIGLVLYALWTVAPPLPMNPAARGLESRLREPIDDFFVRSRLPAPACIYWSKLQQLVCNTALGMQTELTAALLRDDWFEHDKALMKKWERVVGTLQCIDSGSEIGCRFTVRPRLQKDG